MKKTAIQKGKNPYGVGARPNDPQTSTAHPPLPFIAVRVPGALLIPPRQNFPRFAAPFGRPLKNCDCTRCYFSTSRNNPDAISPRPPLSIGTLFAEKTSKPAARRARSRPAATTDRRHGPLSKTCREQKLCGPLARSLRTTMARPRRAPTMIGPLGILGLLRCCD